MEKIDPIKILKDKKSTAEQLKDFLGVSDDFDLLLAKHPNTSAEMLDDICWRQSFDDNIAPVALVHPNLNDEQLFDVGIDYPLAAYKNPKFAGLVAKDKKYLDQFEGDAFESSFKKALPTFVVEWLVSRGKAKYQLIYVSAPKRSPEELEKFRNSKHPSVVAALLDQDLSTYMMWAADVGLQASSASQPADAELRVWIDRLINNVAQGNVSSSTVVSKEPAPLALPQELFTALHGVEEVYFKRGRVAFSSEVTFYQDLISALENFLNNSSQMSKLVAKVVEFDLAEIKKFGSPGKRPPANISSASYYTKSKLDKSFQRLMVAIAHCCQRDSETAWEKLCAALHSLVSAYPPPSAEVRSALDGNITPPIPPELLDKHGKFDIGAMFANKALEQVVSSDPAFLGGFKGPKFEKALGSTTVPEYVVSWLIAKGSFEQQASYLFATSRAPEVLAKFRVSKHPKIIAQLLLADEATYLAWATELGFEMPPPFEDEPVLVRMEIDDWVEGLDANNSELWKQHVPAEGSAANLQGELVRAIGRLQGELYKNGMMNWGDGSGHYEAFTELIHKSLKAEPTFSRLVKTVIDADVLEIKQTGSRGKAAASGKLARDQIFGSNFLIASDVEKSMQRLGGLINIWCQRNPKLVPYSG